MLKSNKEINFVATKIDIKTKILALLRDKIYCHRRKKIECNSLKYS